MLGPYKFDLRSTVNHQGYSVRWTLCCFCRFLWKRTFRCYNGRITGCDIGGRHGSSAAYMLLYKLFVYRPGCEDGSLSMPIITGRGVGTGTGKMDTVFPPGDLWFGSDTSTNYAVLYYLYLGFWVVGRVVVYAFISDGRMDGLWSLALSWRWLSCNGCWLCLLGMKWLLCGTLFLRMFRYLRCFCQKTEYLLKKKTGMDKIPKNFSTWDLHTILRIISRGVPGLATNYPCGVWGRGWISCLL